jgi:transposase
MSNNQSNSNDQTTNKNTSTHVRRGRAVGAYSAHRSNDIRSAVVKQLLERNKTQKELAKEYGVCTATIANWKKAFVGREIVENKISVLPRKNRTADEKFRLIIGASVLDNKGLADFLKKEKIDENELLIWKQHAISGIENDGNVDIKTYQEKIQTLQTDLSRKNEALAEAAIKLLNIK